MRKSSTLAIAALLTATTVAYAEPKLAPSYFFTGDVEGKFDEGSLRLGAVEGGVMSASAVEKRKRNQVEWTGFARLNGRTLTVIRAAGPAIGVVGALNGERIPDGSLEYVFALDQKLEGGMARVYRLSNGTRTEIGTARIRDEKPIWASLPGDLIGLVEKEISKAVHKEIDLGTEFSIGNYTHVGARMSAQILRDADRTVLMKESDRLFRADGKGEPFWVRSILEGGPRVAWSTSVPIDPSGAVSVSVGFQAGAKIRYVCDDQHRVPDGIRDYNGALATIEAVPARVFKLPVSAAKALELPLGSRRTFEGNGSLALSGGLAFGYKLQDMGVLNGRIDVGGSSGVSVWWRYSGDFRLEVERLAGSQMRVRWTRTRVKGFGGSASAVLGLTVSPDLLAKLGNAEKPVEAVVAQGEKYTKVELSVSADWANTRELVLDFTFDLNEPKARAAYERAIIGNLISAQSLAADKDPGIKASRITDTLTDALAFSASLRAFKILSASYTSRSADVHVDVATPLTGVTSNDTTATYDRHTTGLFGGSNTLNVAATTREVIRADKTSTLTSRATFHYEREDDKGYWDEVDQQLALMSALVGAPIDAQAAAVKAARQGSSGNYGKTKLVLDVALGDRAIERILAVSDDAFYAAFAKACVGQNYDWTPEVRRYLRDVSTFANNDDSYADQQKKEEARALQDANAMLKVLRKAAKTGASRADRIGAFRKTARSDGYQMRAVVAFALIAGEDDVATSASLTGKGLTVTGARGEATPLPTH